MSLEQDPARLALQRRRQQQQLLQQQYGSYLPEGATVLGVQDVPRELITPRFVPLSEREYRGGYTAISYAMPGQKQPVMDAQTKAYLGIGEALAAEREAQRQTPKGTTLQTVLRTPEGYQATYRYKEGSFSDVWLQGATLEDLLSQLAFRNIWDVGYKKEWKARQEKFWASYDVPTIQRQQTQQLEVGASIAIIGYAAFDIGRSLYHIAKWGGARGPIEITPTSPELEEAPFTYTQFTGPKGARTTSTLTYTPQEPKPEQFNITWTRGTPTTPMKVTLDKVLKGARASTTLPQLLLWPTQLETKIPLGLYYPQFLTELTFTGISIGSLFRVSQQPITRQVQRIIQIPRLELPERLFRKQDVQWIQRTRQIPSIAQMLRTLTQTQVTQTQALEQNQALKQVQSVAQALAQIQPLKLLQQQKTTFPQFPRLGGDERGAGGRKSLFGKWFRKQQLIKTPRQMLQTFFGTPKKPKKIKKGKKK